jgi:Zn-dependent protease
MLGLSVATILSRIVILVISLTFHEFAHAITANSFGDDTPRANGRLTLNPVAHLDPMGSLMLLFAGFGWARPVPINPYALQRRSPSAVMWVSLAGPASNLLLAIAAAIPLRFGLVPVDFSSGGMLPTPYIFLLEFIAINLLLMVFNLIPLAPLDGEKIADYLLPPSATRVLDTIRPYGPVILLLLIFVGPMIGLNVIGWILGPIMNLFGRLLGVPL